MSSRVNRMKELEEKLCKFKKTPLYKYRKSNKYHPVIGEGSINAKILFIGEAPGKNEAEQGKPFCGRSGKMLDTLLESVSLERKDVYITNIVKDRPPNNRDPRKEEIELYAPFLDEQLSIIKPKIIATLGRFSMEWVFNHLDVGELLEPISIMHGKKFEVKAHFGKVTLIPLYHPAVALYNGGMKDTLLKDFKVLR